MERWLTTAQAAEILGTTTTTVRSLANKGHLVSQVSPRVHRQRWLVSEGSTHEYLLQHGRFDERRRGRLTATAPASDAEAQDELGRLRGEVVALRDVALRLRARNEAVAAAEAHQARSAELLVGALDEQAKAVAQLRRALGEQDDALGQLLTPGTAPPPG